MSTDPVTFLEAALTRAEELARAATEGPWGPQGDWSDDEVCSVLGGRGDLVGYPVAYVRAQRPGCLALDEARTVANMRLIVAQADPLAVLRRVKADRALLADLLAERHEVVDGDCWYTCAAATEERDGGESCDDDRHGGPCDCGRDARVGRRVRLLAEGYGWVAS